MMPHFAMVVGDRLFVTDFVGHGKLLFIATIITGAQLTKPIGAKSISGL